MNLLRWVVFVLVLASVRVFAGEPATAVATVTAGFVSGITVTSGGSGYTSEPVVTITGGGGTGATAKAILSGDRVAVVLLITAGTGYASVPAVTIQPPSTGLSLKVRLVPQITVHGIAGKVAKVESASSLVGPWSAWTNVTATPEGTAIFDTDPATYAKYYRASVMQKSPGQVDWRIIDSSKVPITTSPSIDGGTAYLSVGGSVTAIDEVSGTLKWRTRPDKIINSSPVVIGSDKIVAAGLGSIYGINRITGFIEWEYRDTIYYNSNPQRAQRLSDICLGANGMLFSVIANRLVCLRASDGQLVYTVQTQDAADAQSIAPIADSQNVFTGVGSLACHRQINGAIVWTWRDSYALGSVGFAGTGEILVASQKSFPKSTTYRIETMNGVVRKEALGVIRLVGQNAKCYGTDDNKVFCRSLDQMDVSNWSTPTGASIRSVALGDSNVLYVGSDAIYAIDALTGQTLWSFKTGSLITSDLCISDSGNLVFGCLDASIYSVTTESQGLAASPWPMVRGDNRNRGTLRQ